MKEITARLSAGGGIFFSNPGCRSGFSVYYFVADGGKIELPMSPPPDFAERQKLVEGRNMQMPRGLGFMRIENPHTLVAGAKLTLKISVPDETKYTFVKGNKKKL